MSELLVDVDVLIEDPAWRSVPRIKALTARAVAAALAAAKPAHRRLAVCVALVDDRAIARLNHDFRGLAKATDVLAFPQLPGKLRAIATRLEAASRSRAPLGLGDVVVASRTAAEGARAARVSLAHHVAHLIVHGTLHLLGHDHATLAETRRMRPLETAALASIGIADPWATQEKRRT